MGKKNLKVIAMAVICIVLAASLVAVLAIGQNFQTQAANKDATIKQLQQQISALELQTNVTTVMAQLATVEQNLTQETATADSYGSIANLTATATPVSNQAVSEAGNTSTAVWNNPLNYAGYITVQVQSSSNTTYVETAYSNLGVTFDQKIKVGTEGTASFPIVPGTGSIDISIGNVDPSVYQ